MPFTSGCADSAAKNKGKAQCFTWDPPAVDGRRPPRAITCFVQGLENSWIRIQPQDKSTAEGPIRKFKKHPKTGVSFSDCFSWFLNLGWAQDEFEKHMMKIKELQRSREEEVQGGWYTEERMKADLGYSPYLVYVKIIFCIFYIPFFTDWFQRIFLIWHACFNPEGLGVSCESLLQPLSQRARKAGSFTSKKLKSLRRV